MRNPLPTVPAILAALLGAAPAYAGAGRLVEVAIEVEGRRTPLYAAIDGSERHYFEARAGARYQIALRNRTAERLGVVLNVDGLNVISGELDAEDGRGRMYVLDPHGHARVRGWRRSLESVHRFEFVDEGRSYAVRAGKSNARLGWVELAVYREHRPERRLHLREQDEIARSREDRAAGRSESEAPAASPPATSPPAKAGEGVTGARDQAAPRRYPGTGWGERVHDRAVVVAFHPRPRPAEHITLRYEYREALMALGVLPSPHWRDRLAERDGGLGFAEPPR